MKSNEERRENEMLERTRSGVIRAVGVEGRHAFLPSKATTETTELHAFDCDDSLEQKTLKILAVHVGDIMARSVLIHCTKTSNVTLGRLLPGDAEKLLTHLEKGIRLYVLGQNARTVCVEQLAALFKKRIVANPNDYERIIPIRAEIDIVTARNAGRDICKVLGFSVTGQTRVATAISELARNIVQYTPGGTMSISTIEGSRRGITIVAKDTGSGIKHLDEILAGNYVSRTGMGKGLAGTRQLMDSFVVYTGPSGTEITARKYANITAVSV